LEQYSLLLDCGWTSDFDPQLWAIVEPYVGELQAVLLSNSELEYSGMMTMVCLHPLFTGAVYSTQPVHKLAQMALYDAYLARLSEGCSAPIDIEKIGRAFDQLQPLNYSQRVQVKSQQHGEESLYLSAHCAGHAIGSAVWKINYNLQDFLYAPCFNPHESQALAGLDFASITKPALLLMDAWHANSQHIPDASLRLCQLVRSTLSDGGNVLIPVSPSGNVLDLLLVLENFWNSERDFLQNYSLVFLGHVSTPTVEFAKSNLEWMNPRVVSNFESSGENPFNFKYVKFARCEEDLPSPPFCVLSSSASLTGLSSKLVANLAESPHNLVVFTDLPRAGLPAELVGGLKQKTVTVHRVHFVEDKRELLSDQESTDIGESAVLDILEDLPHSKLFEEKNFPCFAAFDVKGFVDEYGELMPEEETAQWRHETHDGLEDMTLLKTLAQSLQAKLV
jgi:cleavage and polyadenylation specificity factor subunit 2